MEQFVLDIWSYRNDADNGLMAREKNKIERKVKKVDNYESKPFTFGKSLLDMPVSEEIKEDKEEIDVFKYIEHVEVKKEDYNVKSANKIKEKKLVPCKINGINVISSFRKTFYKEITFEYNDTSYSYIVRDGALTITPICGKILAAQFKEISKQIGYTKIQ